jgi:hypothetical protein
MEKVSVINKGEKNNIQAVKNNFKDKRVLKEEDKGNPVFDSLISEGGEDFFNYINWLGFSKDPNLMVLSSIHHYYYDFNELKGVRTLINIKQLNQINHIDSFLNNVFRVLPPKASFVGCFKDNKIRRGMAGPFYQSFKLLSSLINLIDSKTDRFLSRKYVIKLLESHEFRITDMTEIGDITYFCAQNNKKSA